MNVCQSETSFNGDVRGEGPVQRKGKVKNIIPYCVVSALVVLVVVVVAVVFSLVCYYRTHF